MEFKREIGNHYAAQSAVDAVDTWIRNQRDYFVELRIVSEGKYETLTRILKPGDLAEKDKIPHPLIAGYLKWDGDLTVAMHIVLVANYVHCPTPYFH